MADPNTVQRAVNGLGSTIVRAGELVRKARIEFGRAHEPKQRRRVALVACLAACLMTGLLVARLGRNSALDYVEAPLKNLRVRAFENPEVRDPDILIIAIDENALAYGDNPSITRAQQSQRYSWPWPRHVYNKLIRYCRQGGARVIVFDFFFSETGPNTNDPVRKVEIAGKPAWVWQGDKGGDDLFILEATAEQDVAVAVGLTDMRRETERRDIVLNNYAAELTGDAKGAMAAKLEERTALRSTPVTPMAGLLNGWPVSTFMGDLAEMPTQQRREEVAGYFMQLEKKSDAFRTDRFSSLLPLPSATLRGVGGVGAVDVYHDPADGVLRRYPAVTTLQGKPFRHLALETWRLFVLSYASEASADPARRDAFAARFPGLSVDDDGLRAGNSTYALDDGLRDVPIAVDDGRLRYLGLDIPVDEDGQYHLRYRTPITVEQDPVYRFAPDDSHRDALREEYARAPVTALYPTVSAAYVLADWDAWHYRHVGYARWRADLLKQIERAQRTVTDATDESRQRAEADLAALQKRLADLPEEGPSSGWPTVRMGEPADLVKDKVVFIAGTAAALSDRHATPWSPVTPGTYVLANSFDNVRNGDFMRPAPRWAEWLLGLAACVVAVLAVIYAGSMRNGLILVVLLAGLAIVASWSGFNAQWWVPTAAPLAGLFIGFSNGALAKALTEGRQRRHREAFARQYMGKELLDFVIRNPGSLKLGGENREMTVYFSDVAGFTTVAETLGPNNPQRLVELLNIYLERMTDVMLETGGVIDKYIGDAIMCFWGAPMDMQDHAVRACRGALACRAELQRMQPLFADAIRDLAPQLIQPGGGVLRARAGINSGLMTVGNMGSSKRFAYTVMGDAVNLGARLEPQCKEYGIDILVGQNTERLIRGEFTLRPTDLIVVEGKTEPVEVFELIGGKEVPQFVSDMLAHYTRGIVQFRAREFEAALAGFRNAAQHEPPREDDMNPSRLYIQRCEELLKAPPPSNWDTVYRKKSK